MGFYKWLRVWAFLNAYEDKTSSNSLLESQAASACSEETLPAVKRFGRTEEKTVKSHHNLKLFPPLPHNESSSDLPRTSESRTALITQSRNLS